MHVRTVAMAERATGGHTAWLMLGLLSAAELLGMSLWFTASAVAGELATVWNLSTAEAGWLTTIVQLGFVAGTAAAALLNLSDILPARYYVAGAAVLAACANAALLIAPTFAVALLLRFATGLFLAGVYPPAMKMVATWFAPAGGATNTQRGLAIGTVVGALTIGKAMPYLLRTFEQLTYRDVLLWGSIGAFVAALLVLLAYRDGPFAFPKRPFSWRLVGVVAQDRKTRLAIGGYLGHMWELYAMWALISAFFANFFAARGAGDLTVTAYAGAAAFAVIAAGGIGSVLAGQWADRLGREKVTIWSMVVSGTCALTMGWLLHASPWLVLTVGLVWGFAIVADSAQFSAVVTEVAPPHAVGTALTLQTSLGFLLTAFSIWFTIQVQSRFGWPVAFGLLAVGPVFGIAAMLRLQGIRSPVASGE